MIATAQDPNDWSDLLKPEHSGEIKNAVVVRADCTNDDYMAHKREGNRLVMSRSELREFSANPRRWKNGGREDDKETKSTEFGSLLDTMLLQPSQMGARWTTIPETYEAETKKGVFEEKPWTFKATFCSQWRDAELSAGRQCVKQEVRDNAALACESVCNDNQLARLVANSQCQVFCKAEYHDFATKIVVPLKCMIDLAPDKDSEFPLALFDLKTTNSAAYRYWIGEINKWGYHWQAAIELDIWNAATGEARYDFNHIIVESFAPFDVTKRYLDPDFLAIGRSGYMGALKQYCQCLESNEWPGHKAPPSLLTVKGFEQARPEPYMVQ